MEYLISESGALPFPPQQVWILGAGRFGYLAVRRLTSRFQGAAFTVIDDREDRIEKVRHDFPVATRTEEAMAFLSAAPLPDDLWIVPAVPVHVAFRWILGSLNRHGRAQDLPVPDTVDAQVPNPYRVEDGTVYTSLATFQCPDNCNEPDHLCTTTRQPRLGNLFERLAEVTAPEFRVIVVRSLQLAPGVGGYLGGSLKQSLDQVTQSQGSYLVATSCRCHGVINALRWE